MRSAWLHLTECEIHVAGALGAAVTARLLDLGYLERRTATRSVTEARTVLRRHYRDKSFSRPYRSKNRSTAWPRQDGIEAACALAVRSRIQESKRDGCF